VTVYKPIHYNYTNMKYTGICKQPNYINYVKP
jgi:hypothetical protein